jgi:hypothetical protein
VELLSGLNREKKLCCLRRVCRMAVGSAMTRPGAWAYGASLRRDLSKLTPLLIGGALLIGAFAVWKLPRKSRRSSCR